MKRLTLLGMLFLAACDAWSVTLPPSPVQTVVPTRTPFVLSATPPIIFPTLTILPTITTSPTISPTLPTFTPSPNASPSATPTPLPTTTPVILTQTPFPAVEVNILGCNTGFDLTHGMGEVTNAYVNIANTGNTDLPNLCALLRANDEGRIHPDKIHCVENLPSGYQVTLKLTVDSTFRQDTAVQVDVSSNNILLQHVDQAACRDLNLSGTLPPDVGVIRPISP